MIHSMTGYAVASADSPRGAVTLELRSVNSRFLDLQFRVAEELRAAEPMLRDLIAGRIARGKVDCRLSLGNGVPQAQMRLNVQAIQQLRSLATAAGEAFPGIAPLRTADVLRWPGVLAEPAADEERTHARWTGFAAARWTIFAQRAAAKARSWPPPCSAASPRCAAGWRRSRRSCPRRWRPIARGSPNACAR